MKKGYWFLLPWRLEYPGGVNQVVLNLDSQFRGQGFASSIFVQSWEDAGFREDGYYDHAVRYGRLRSPVSDSLKGGLAYWLTLPATLLRLSKALREENVVCVNPHYPSTSFFTFVLLRKLGGFRGRLWLSFHGLDFTAIESSTGFNRWIWLYILRNADVFVACSQSLRKRISDKFPELAERIRVVHNGFDPQAFEAKRDKEALLPADLAGADFILNVGAYEHKKGLDVLLRAFHEVAGRHPAVRLVVLGRSVSEACYAELQRMVEEFGFQDKVSLIKDMPHAKIAPFYEAARCFVLPSRAESLPVSVLEAGAFGLPVVASRVDGLPEILTSPDLGTLVAPDDPAALAGAMLKVLEEPEWAKGIGENLRQRVRSHFNWRNAADEYLAPLKPTLD